MRTAQARLVTTAISTIPVLAAYTLVNGAVPPRYDLALAVDAAIPLLPWTLPLYMSMYVFLLVAAAAVDDATFRRGLAALLAISLISFGLFLLLPAAYPQPDPGTLSPPWDAAFRYLHSVDKPQNTFPSLHIGITTTVAWMLRHHRLRWLWFVWAGGIALTTLTTKQHFIVDVAGGLAVALVVNLLVSRLYPPRRATPAEHR